MVFRHRSQYCLLKELDSYLIPMRFCSNEINWNKLRPLILDRIKTRCRDYPLRHRIPVAYDVLRARDLLIEGVSSLLKVIPVKSCRFCPEVYIGDTGHQIKTCHGPKGIKKNQLHKWINGNLNDVLVQVQSSQFQRMPKDFINSHNRSNLDRVPAILELCHQVGVDVPYNAQLHDSISASSGRGASSAIAPLSVEELSSVAQKTLDSWERLRFGVHKLLSVCPSKVCKHCSEVHIGRFSRKAQSIQESHIWKKVEVDDLVPPKFVWHRRPHDPPVLLDSGRGFYGHAPAVVELCSQAGARVPIKYFCMMKLLGLTKT